MHYVYFIENKDVVLCQILENIPNVNDVIKIKGRKGTVLRVEKNENRPIEIFIELEKKVKKPLPEVDKRKRR